MYSCVLAFDPIVFKRGDQDAVEAFRRKLSLSWHHLTLTLDKDNRDIRDWVLAAMPFVFTQATYRLLCDAFKDDKKCFVSTAQSVVDKIISVISFEITGFQQNKETLRKERRRLFLPRVTVQPHINQRDVVKGIKRQEMLDDRRSNGVPSLAFGNVQPEHEIDEVQLDHLMTRHNEHKANEATQAAVDDSGLTGFEVNSAALKKPEKRAAINPELDVDRYNALTESIEIVDKQLDRFDECTDKYATTPFTSLFDTQQLVKRFSGKELAELDQQSEIGAPTPGPSSPEGSREIPLSKSLGSSGGLLRQSRAVEFEDGELNVTYESRRLVNTLNAWQDGDASPGGSSQPSTPTLKRAQTRFLRATPKAKSRESMAKMQRMRQEQLEKLCRDEPLPEELRSREVNTGWVSPAFVRLTRSGRSERCVAKGAAGLI